MDTFSKRLALALGEAGLSQADLARSVDVNPSTVNHWCSGKRCPKPDDTKRIAATLGVRAAWLLLGDGDMRETDASAPAPPPAPAPKPRKRTAPRRSSAAPPPGPARATPGRRSTKAAA
jgi:transcriptional regulator with XRE-family HTH domain